MRLRVVVIVRAEQLAFHRRQPSSMHSNVRFTQAPPMTSRHTSSLRSVALILMLMGAAWQTAWPQDSAISRIHEGLTHVYQQVLIQKILGSNAAERARAIFDAKQLEAARIGAPLRAALIEALEHEGRRHQERYEADKRGERLTDMENPELISQLAQVVADFRDTTAIPALAGSMGSGFPSINALAEFGEPAAVAVLGIIAAPNTMPENVSSGLIVLRRLMEGNDTRPLTFETRSRIRHAAVKHLATGSGVALTSMWRAIDVAVVLDDPGLRAMVQAIAKDSNELMRRGVTDPSLIAASQRKAIAALAATEGRGEPIRFPLSELQSPIDTIRIRAFYAMVLQANGGKSREPDRRFSERAAWQEDLARALIALLERENAIIEGARPGSLSEEHVGYYYPELFVTVARMRDRRAIPALMSAIQYGDFLLAEVVAFGEAAVSDLIRTLDNHDALRQSAAARALGRIADRRVDLGLDESRASEIRIALLRAVKDPDNFTLRLNATEALGAFSDSEVRAEMERVAQSDTYSVQRGVGPRRFPVREAAQAWLARVP